MNVIPVENSILKWQIWKPKEILMWFLWKFLHSKTKFEDSHQECSWRQKKLQTWHLQKYLFISAKPSHSQECCLCDKLIMKEMKIKTVAHVMWKINQSIMKYITKYKCNYCAKSYTESGNLKRHIKTVHLGQSNYKCDSCGKSFTTSEYLKTYIKTIH